MTVHARPWTAWWRRISDAVLPGTRGATLPATGLAGLLDPELRVVPYEGRDAELAELLDWCHAPEPVRVRLTTGPGGTGKTRLAVEAVRRLPAGWDRVWLGPQDPPGAARDIVPSHRTLVVVDGAPARGDLVGILDALPRPAGHGRLRVLLLARTGREWWYRLRWASTLWCDGAVPTSHTHLAPPRDDDEQALVTAAARAFARRLGTTPPAPAVRTSAGRPSLLDLHAAALLAVADGSGAAPVDPAGALTSLLEHERARWAEAAARAGLPVDDVDDAVAAGMLLGTATDDDALDALRRSAPVLATPAGVAWLRGLAGDAGDVAAAVPRLLTERHVERRLAATPWFADDWVRRVPVPAARRVVAIATSLETDLPAGGGSGPVEALLRRVAREMPADAEALAGLLHLLPQRPVPPGELAEEVTARIIALDTAPAAWADALTHRAAALLTLGRHRDASQTASEAVAAWRAAVTGDQGRYEWCLARALTVLGSVRLALGRHHDALGHLTEALAILRRAPAREAEWTGPELAGTLHALSVAHQQLGRHAEHERTSLEEVAVLRRLTQRDPDRFEAQLGRSLLGRLAVVDHGRPLEALNASAEALALWRRLAQAGHDVEPELARALSARGHVLAELGRLEEAIVAENEALEMRRHLAAADPGRHDWELSTSLARLGAHLSGLGRAQHARALETEALALRRRLARENPQAYAYMLASSLSNLGVTCARLGRYAEALPLEQEAVAIRRDLAREAPQRYELYLARSLSNFGVRLSDVGETGRAVEPTREAVEILRRRVATDPDRHRPDLAAACTNLGATYADLGRTDEAAGLLTESAGLLRGLAAAYPARFRPELARACSTLASLELRLGRSEIALEHATEAVAIRRDLVAVHGDRYREALETSLAVLAEACDPRTSGSAPARPAGTPVARR